MTNLIGIYDHTTGENVIREMTSQEKEQRELEIKAWLTAKENDKLEAKKLRETKIAAYQKLGLTEAEIEALLPTSNPIEVTAYAN